MRARPYCLTLIASGLHRPVVVRATLALVLPVLRNSVATSQLLFIDKRGWINIVALEPLRVKSEFMIGHR